MSAPHSPSTTRSGDLPGEGVCSASGSGPLDSWLLGHRTTIAAGAIGLGLVLRIVAALSTFLSPHETESLRFAALPIGQILTGARSTDLPLYLVLLHFWQGIARTELMLRLPAAVCGTIALWFAYRWLGLLLSDLAAWSGLLLLACAPTVVVLTSSVQPYGLLFLLLLAALWVLELAFVRASWRLMLVFTSLLLLSVLTHHSAVWLALALTLWVLLRLSLTRQSVMRRFMLVWAAGQVAVCLAAVYCLPSVPTLARIDLTGTFSDPWLAQSYFQSGHSDNPVFFAIRQTVAVFRYLFSSPPDGWFMILFFLAGILMLALRAQKQEGRPARDRTLPLLLLLPFVFYWAAASLGLYPYGATRQAVILALLAITGVGALIGLLFRIKPVVGLAAAGLLALVWNLSSTPPAELIRVADRRPDLMKTTAAYVREIVTPGQLIFCDSRTQNLLSRYLYQGIAAPHGTVRKGFNEIVHPNCHLVASVRYADFPTTEFGDEFERMAREYQLKQGDTVCVVSVSSGPSLSTRIRNDFGLSYPSERTFGTGISVFQLPVGLEPSSEYLAFLAAKLCDELVTMTETVVERSGEAFKTILWPSEILSDSIRGVLHSLARRTLSYAELYEALVHRGPSMDDYVPALAIWLFGARERHIQGMSYMNDAEHYVAGGYRFTLLELTPDSAAAAYAIERLDTLPGNAPNRTLRP